MNVRYPHCLFSAIVVCIFDITLATSLDPDQARQHAGSDLDWIQTAFLKDFVENVNFEKTIGRRQSICIQIYPAWKKLNSI